MLDEQSNRTEQVARAFIEAVNWTSRTDPLDLCSDDTRFEDTAFGVVVQGKGPYAALFRKFHESVPDEESEVKSVIASGEWAAVVWTFSGTQKGDFPGIPSTGKRFSVRGVSMIQVKDGKVKSRTDYWDSATMLRQLGLIPAR